MKPKGEESPCGVLLGESQTVPKEGKKRGRGREREREREKEGMLRICVCVCVVR